METDKKDKGTLEYVPGATDDGMGFFPVITCQIGGQPPQGALGGSSETSASSGQAGGPVGGQCRRMIGFLIARENLEEMFQGTPFNRARYVENLRRLPQIADL